MLAVLTLAFLFSFFFFIYLQLVQHSYHIFLVNVITVDFLHFRANRHKTKPNICQVIRGIH